jgi:hypothetical protein
MKNYMQISKETPEQSRIRKAFANFPYSGSAQLNFDDVMTYEVIAINLETIKTAVEAAVTSSSNTVRELDELKNEIHSAGKLLKRLLA